MRERSDSDIGKGHADSVDDADQCRITDFKIFDGGFQFLEGIIFSIVDCRLCGLVGKFDELIGLFAGMESTAFDLNGIVPTNRRNRHDAELSENRHEVSKQLP